MTRDVTRSEDARAAGAVPPGPGGAPAAEVSAPAAEVSASARVITSQAAGQAAAENFPVALRLLPGRYRRHLAAVYGFARSADDMGDEAPVAERLALLDELEADIGRLYGPGGPRLAVVAALAPAVAECAIPAQPFLDLIQANRQDQKVSRYQTRAELMAYCALSASPVGRIVLHVFGAATPQREQLSDRVCTALQLAEHWQDVAEDLRAGRIYLPAEDMAAHRVTEADLAVPTASPRVRELMAAEAGWARELLGSGAPIVGTLRGAARAAVAGYVAGGRAALAAIAARGHDVLTTTPRPAKRRVAAELARAYLTGR